MHIISDKGPPGYRIKGRGHIDSLTTQGAQLKYNRIIVTWWANYKSVLTQAFQAGECIVEFTCELFQIAVLILNQTFTLVGFR